MTRIKLPREERIKRGLVKGFNLLADPRFRARVVKDKTKYSRKGRAVSTQFADGSFFAL